MTREIYLDNAATSFPKAEGVSERMKDYLDRVGVNIGRASYAKSTEAGMDVISVREKLAEAFGCSDPRRVIFTEGCTGALNRVIAGSVQAGDTVLVSSMEHNAVIRPLTELGCVIRRIPSDRNGVILFDRIEESLDSVKLCVICHASNVFGTIQPVEQLAEILKRFEIPLVLDAAQSAGCIPIDMEKWGLSALCIPGHKGLRGPQGIGVLMLSEAFAKQLRPVVFGGTGSMSHCDRMPKFLPDRFEAGTLNLPGIFGLGAAMEHFDPVSVREHDIRLTARFMDQLKEIPGIRIPGSMNPEERVGVVSVDFRLMDNAEAADELEQKYGILTRCGLHCSPEAHKTMGTFPQGTVRFSFSSATTEEEIDLAAEAIQKIVNSK